MNSLPNILFRKISININVQMLRHCPSMLVLQRVYLIILPRKNVRKSSEFSAYCANIWESYKRFKKYENFSKLCNNKIFYRLFIYEFKQLHYLLTSTEFYLLYNECIISKVFRTSIYWNFTVKVSNNLKIFV